MSEAVDKKQIAIAKGKLTKAEKIAATVVIKDQKSYESAGQQYLIIKKLEKEFEKEYDSWMSPINALRNKVFEISRPMKKRFAEAKGILDKAMGDWERKIEEENRKAAEELEKAADSGEMTLAEATDKAGKLESVDNVETSTGKLGQQIRHELVIADEAKLKREFLVPDMGKIKAHYEATGRLPDGVKLEKKVIRTARMA